MYNEQTNDKFPPPGGEVVNVLFAALIGGFALGMAAPNIQHFVAGRSAFGRLKRVLDRHAIAPETDPRLARCRLHCPVGVLQSPLLRMHGKQQV